MVRLGTWGLLLMGLAQSAKAEPPEAVCFVYAESLAVTLDSQSLLSTARSEKLQDGYPISWEVRLSLHQRVPMWFDVQWGEASMRWQLVRQTIDGRFRLSYVDFQGRDAVQICDDLSEVRSHMEDFLLAILTPLSSLPSDAKYYVKTEISCRTLSFDDLLQTERWLKEGSGARGDSSASVSPSGGEVFLRYLWDVAGLRPEKDGSRTEIFRVHELRRLD